MKRFSPVGSWLTRSSLVITLAGLVWLPAHAFGQEKGATKLLEFKPKHTTAQTAPAAAAVEPMQCAKCADTWMAVKQFSSKGSEPEISWRQVHACSECQTRMVTSGHGKAKVTKAVHQCPQCVSPAAASSGAHSGHSE